MAWQQQSRGEKGDVCVGRALGHVRCPLAGLFLHHIVAKNLVYLRHTTFK